MTNRPAHPDVEELKLMESVKEKVLAFAESLKNIFSVPKVINEPINERDSWSFTAEESNELWNRGQAEYAKAFAWYDGDPALDKDGDGYPDQKSSYKLPHHKLDNGRLTLYRSGIVAAMAALNGARGGVDLPQSERQKVYEHLAEHYKALKMELPKLSEVKGMDEEVKKQLVDLSEANKTLSEKIDILLKERKELSDRLFAERKQAWKKAWIDKGIAPAMMDKIDKVVSNEDDFRKFDDILESSPKIDLTVKGTEIPHDVSDAQRAENVAKAIFGGEI